MGAVAAGGEQPAAELVQGDVATEQWERAGETASNSAGILQIGWWAARINSSLSFSF